MRIAAAQCETVAGDIQENSHRHYELIHKAAKQKVDCIVFSELSLTGYEPKHAKDLALQPSSSILDSFQQLSDHYSMMISLGAPLQSRDLPFIGMVTFTPNEKRQWYAKRRLFSGELPFFSAGTSLRCLTWGDEQIGPAICYESCQPEHVAEVVQAGATVYMASVAKSATDVKKAIPFYQKVAREQRIVVIMSNCMGPCDDFVGAGSSAVWDRNGQCVAALNQEQIGLVGYDTLSRNGFIA
ncbi:carbon-nitrogen hydrolase family protein [Marinibactrum halimedae]|uniref:Hydrolase n=1 Tax=Marinibactrum halimedae TaxID=1444977 RepID=A0AA37TDQ7_9GAMM|nr:carbon-nitrogen hydrolase family protein [Marinibactrum halimedae]MCD9457595.1 carbon-nitrogen hydrolase family protein [Marinibactrum halimedae]GLS28015.1 hydrolase [Marinibactrum halimedae]